MAKCQLVADEANICHGQYTKDYNLISHPYNCKRFVNCTKDGTFVKDDFVWGYTDGNHVFDPQTEMSNRLSDVPCARQSGKSTYTRVTKCSRAHARTYEDTLLLLLLK